MQRYREKIEKTIEILKENISEVLDFPLCGEYIGCDYKTSNILPEVTDEWIRFSEYFRVGGYDKHFWFHLQFITPEKNEGKRINLSLRTSFTLGWDAVNPQCILYLNGEIVQGLDLNHTTYELEYSKEYDVYVYFYTGVRPKEMFDCCFNLTEDDLLIEKLCYDFAVPFEGASAFKTEDERCIKTIKPLGIAANIIDFTNVKSEGFYNSLKEAEKYLQENFYEKECGKSEAVVHCIGHTHIDVAWQWTYAQTKEKVQRSFATVLALMDKYPEYKFVSSQPQLYEYLKEEAPALYEKVKQRVKEGRWEVDGAMWVEADCNLISGESFVRQILFGKRFIKDEFGVDSKILWLPDVFGYSAALPQILKKCGVDKFVTSKISWNDHNMLPVDTFMWEGIDGNEIFTQFITAQDVTPDLVPTRKTTYVGYLKTREVLGTHLRYQQKAYNNETLLTYGFGDGGGGPTKEMLEYNRRIAYGLPGIPKSKLSHVKDALASIEENFKKGCKELNLTPKWVGELYLEFHRGTYTSIAKNKKHNRKCEFLYKNTEAASVMDMVLNGGNYNQSMINHGWKTILLNQFHDVIPGSSIKEVYDDSDIMYAEIEKSGNDEYETKLAALAENVTSPTGLMVYNPNGFTCSNTVCHDGKSYFAKDVPAFGWTSLDTGYEAEAKAKACGKVAENKFYKLTLDENGNISSLLDKRSNREVFKAAANQIVMFEDRPLLYDAWELHKSHTLKKTLINNVKSIDAFEDNTGAGFIIKREFSNSVLEQKVILYNDLDRIDFETYVDWHENSMVLKTEFPINVNASKATYEIQYGHIERPTHRNTSWDDAKFEVCAHKWADISDGGYGMSLMNDCKYGHSATGSTLMLTLLKSAIDPYKEADRGEHTFTYSILPHEGDLVNAGTIKKAYAMNNPMIAVKTGENGILPQEFSFVSCDSDNVIIDTMKKAEDSDDIIVRMYESQNKSGRCKLDFGVDIKEAVICDMMENELEKAEISGNTVNIEYKNFEIITLKVSVIKK